MSAKKFRNYQSVDQSRIIQKGIESLQGIEAGINDIFALAMPHMPGGPEYTTEPTGVIFEFNDIETKLLYIAHHQSIAYGCLFNDEKKRSTETVEAAALRQIRVRDFRIKCDNVPISQLRNRGIRNALSHFEERYLESLMSTHGKEVVCIENFVLSHHNIFKIAPHLTPVFINVYHMDTDCYYLFGCTLKLSELRAEIDEVLNALGLSFDKSYRIPRPEFRPLPSARSTMYGDHLG